MYSLDTIRSLNAKAAAPVEDNFSRLCSFTRSPRGIVLHSALKRSTAHLDGDEAAKFLRMAARNRTPAKRNALIESYFS